MEISDFSNGLCVCVCVCSCVCAHSCTQVLVCAKGKQLHTMAPQGDLPVILKFFLWWLLPLKIPKNLSFMVMGFLSFYCLIPFNENSLTFTGRVRDKMGNRADLFCTTCSLLSKGTKCRPPYSVSSLPLPLSPLSSVWPSLSFWCFSKEAESSGSGFEEQLARHSGKS